MLLCMADITQELTMFTSQGELADQNLASTRVLFIAGILSLSPQFPSPQCLLCRLTLILEHDH